MASRFAALIPCYNVGRACIPVITRTAAQVDLCVAVDDGSTDSTRSSLESLSLPNLHLLRHERNKGKGAALVSGFRFLLEMKIDAVITLDGDGQHDPDLIPRFTAAFTEGHPALVCGNRMADQGTMPLHRQWLNRLSNWTISRICRRSIADSQCGFRLYSRQLIEAVIGKLKTVHYEMETEILIHASRLGMDVRFVPVSTIYTRETNDLSHHSLFDVLRIARLVTVHFLNR
jgi:glycosyltransferase involved in cell wall biosynthesis